MARGSRSRAQAGGQGQSLERRMGVKAKGQQGQTKRRGRGGEGWGKWGGGAEGRG